MTATTSDALQRAIDYLGAVCVRPGIKETIMGGDGRGPNRTRQVRQALYARREAPSVPYEIIPAAILREYTPERIACFSRRDRQFCGIVTMPAWWSPEQRFAWRITSPTGKLTYCAGEPGPGIRSDIQVGRGTLERITADLETGAEIAA
jgi:hypothetical protein